MKKLNVSIEIREAICKHIGIKCLAEVSYTRRIIAAVLIWSLLLLFRVQLFEEFACVQHKLFGTITLNGSSIILVVTIINLVVLYVTVRRGVFRNWYQDEIIGRMYTFFNVDKDEEISQKTINHGLMMLATYKITHEKIVRRSRNNGKVSADKLGEICSTYDRAKRRFEGAIDFANELGLRVDRKYIFSEAEKYLDMIEQEVTQTPAT